MRTRRYAQNVLDWSASEALCYMYGCAQMVLVVSPLCDTTGAIFLSLLLVLMALFAAYRLHSTGHSGLLAPMIKPVIVPTVAKWGSGLAALALALWYLRFERLQPSGLWLELAETVAYLAIMAYILVLSVPIAFNTRYKDVIESSKLAGYERRVLQLYYLVVIRLMLHRNEATDWFQADYLRAFQFTFLAFALFLTSFMWKAGFQAAKFE